MFPKRKSSDSKLPVSLTIMPENRIVHASHGDTILEAILDAGLELNHSCGGMGTCGTCRIFVLQGLELLSERNIPESEIAQDRNFLHEERLACQNFAQSGLVIDRGPANTKASIAKK